MVVQCRPTASGPCEDVWHEGHARRWFHEDDSTKMIQVAMHHTKLPLFKPWRPRRSSRAFVVSAALSMIGSAMARCNMGTNVRECFQGETIAVNGLHMKAIPSIRSSRESDFDPAGYCMWKTAECYHWHFGRERHVAACSSLSVFCTIFCFDLIYSFWLLQDLLLLCSALLAHFVSW